MDTSAKVITHTWLAMLVGAAVLAAGLVALCFPVYLHAYDQWGIQIKCGNGYNSELLQATINDQQPASAHVRPATSYVDQCNSALMHRRVWTISVAAVGALILVPELVAWSRGGSPNSSKPTSATPPPEDTDLKTAELLDRKYRSHRSRPSNTTL
jgi:hypothetical protein